MSFNTLFSQEIKTRNTIHIPVVVHILYNEAEQNISDDQIIKQIETLNKDFSKSNENFSNTPSVFLDLAADMGIQFCLALKDPNGNDTDGITRTETFVDEIGLTELYFLSDEGGKDSWDKEHYINIWVADMGTSGILGITPIIGDGSPEEKDGILVNYRYFGVEGDHQDMNRNLGKVLTHEMGHYLGLQHVWGTLGTNCDDDDGIDDTPLQDAPNFGCAEFPVPDICTQGNGVMFTNFMDFSDDECLTMFTEGQKQKVEEVLGEYRPGLLESGEMGCIVNTEEEENIGFEIYPNPASEEVTIRFEREEMNRKVRIYDINGSMIKECEASQQERIYLIGDLSAGIYYIHCGVKARKVVIY